jgi:hypothetical protein
MNDEEFGLIWSRVFFGYESTKFKAGRIRACVERKVQVKSLMQEWEGTLGPPQVWQEPDLLQLPIKAYSQHIS